MEKNKAGESFVGIIIGVFILSIIIIGIGNIMFYSKEIITIYEENNKINILRNNLSNIIKKVDTSNIKENEIFYLYKDSGTKAFKVFTGSTNYLYKYIDEYGDKIDDIVTFEDDIYARLLWLERVDDSLGERNQVLRASIRKMIRK